MTRPGFRKARTGGRGGERAEGFLSGSLFSQAQILHLMKTEFARARRHGFPLGCVLLQVDRIQQLVDLHGAELRVAVRDALVRLVRERTRGADLLGATNEDRYLLLLPHTDAGACRTVGERLHALCSELEVTVDGRALALTVSVGISASGGEQQAMFFDTMVGQAEAALDWAIARGGDRVASFGETQLLAEGSEGRPPRGAGGDARGGADARGGGARGEGGNGEDPAGGDVDAGAPERRRS